MSFMNFRAEKGCFLKIYVALPKFITVLRDLFEKDKVLFRSRIGHFSDVTYEGQIPFLLRFMVDNGLPGMSWIKVDPGRFFVREKEQHASSCCIEVDVVDYRDMYPVPIEEDSSIAPLRILSFDIEVTTDGVHFPTANKDAVIQIANIVKCHGDDSPFVRNCYTLNSCAPIQGTQVYAY